MTGAGDTVIATLASAIASGHDMVHATAFANEAAGLVVAKLGAAYVTVDELNHAVMEHHVKNKGILDNVRLMSVVNEIKKQGETLVMTNGCFDILHAGHVQYLQQAKQLGDYLLVAVNDKIASYKTCTPSNNNHRFYFSPVLTLSIMWLVEQPLSKGSIRTSPLFFITESAPAISST